MQLLSGSSPEPNGGAEEAEMGNDNSNRTPSSVEEIEPVERSTSNIVSIRMVLANAGHTLSGTEAELVLNPLRLAFETKNTKVVELALDCLHVGARFVHNYCLILCPTTARVIIVYKFAMQILCYWHVFLVVSFPHIL